MFVKNDASFVCQNCGKKVEKLRYTSRDHCNHCLYSLHVDITPGDRANTCLGLLRPISIEVNGKKGQVIVYQCERCGKQIKNIVAQDDDMDAMLTVMQQYAKAGGHKIKRKGESSNG